MKELLAFLNSIYPLSQSAREYLIQNLKEIEIPKKKFLLKQGRICHNIYFVEKGLLRCFYRSLKTYKKSREYNISASSKLEIENWVSSCSFIVLLALIYELENIRDKNNLCSRDVMRVLVSLNFNSAAFINYLTNRIINAINIHSEQHEKIDRLNEYFKDINQVRIKPSARFNTHNECVKQQVAGWINEEVYFPEQKLQMAPTMPVMKDEGAIPEEHKLHLSTSVEVLTLLARAGKDSKLILNKQMTGMFRSIARFCRTRNAESPAANSMLKKSYVADRMNKQKAIDILHEMIKCIHRYCVVPAFIYYSYLDEIMDLIF